ncbi:hypothetical protein RI367_003753 [Sorochytrium milnesiophthora]
MADTARSASPGRARASSDETREDRPLLAGHEHSTHITIPPNALLNANRRGNGNDYAADDDDSLAGRWRKRTYLEKVLIGLTLALLLSTAVFATLFAIANSRSVRGPMPPPPEDDLPRGPGDSEPSVPLPLPSPDPNHPERNRTARVCLTADCVAAAATYLQAMDTKVAPCDDFYQYACGKWVQTHDIPADRSRTGTFNQLFEDNLHVIRDILDGQDDAKFAQVLAAMDKDKNGKEREVLDKMQNLYHSCMDEDQVKRVGAESIYRLVKAVNSTFGAAGSGDVRKPLDFKVLSEALLKLHMVGVDALIAVGVDADPLIPEIQTIGLAQAQLGLPSKEYYEQPDYVSVYKKTVEDMLSLLFPTSDESARLMARDPHASVSEVADEAVRNAKKIVHEMWTSFDHWINKHDDKEEVDVIVTLEDAASRRPPPKTPSKPVDWKALAEEVVSFEADLAQISWDNEDLYDPIKTNNPFNVSELPSLIPDFPWHKFLQSAIDETSTDVSLDKLEAPIGVATPSYFRDLGHLLSSTDARTIQVFLIWRIVLSYAPYLDKELRAPLDQLKEKVQGVKGGVEAPRWETCVRTVDRIMGFAAGRWFIEERFGGNSRAEARSLIDGVLNAFVKRLDDIDWLDDATRKIAKAKVNNLDRKVGFPDFILDPTQLAEKYAPLNIDRKRYVDNIIAYNRAMVRYQWHKLEKPTDKSEWGMYPQTVNAYYNPLYNEIVFPAGILQPPFFKASLPDYLNYGAIGVVAGHELCHAFDNNGRHFDERGRLLDWWSNQTATEFDKRAQCFIDQYSSFTITDPKGAKVHVNGRLTLGENLADNGGLQQSWGAWRAKRQQRHDKHNGTDTNDDNDDDSNNRVSDMRLPGLQHLTEEQLFFVSFAQGWCGKARPEAALNAIRTDPHSPGFVRVNAAVQNSQEFAKAFQCKANTNMNPDKKCLLW